MWKWEILSVLSECRIITFDMRSNTFESQDAVSFFLKVWREILSLKETLFEVTLKIYFMEIKVSFVAIFLKEWILLLHRKFSFWFHDRNIHLKTSRMLRQDSSCFLYFPKKLALKIIYEMRNMNNSLNQNSLFFLRWRSIEVKKEAKKD